MMVSFPSHSLYSLYTTFMPCLFLTLSLSLSASSRSTQEAELHRRLIIHSNFDEEAGLGGDSKLMADEKYSIVPRSDSVGKASEPFHHVTTFFLRILVPWEVG